ncbi:hypothetical protein P4S72_20075, partial [Vibrio sp. PP-XX7]
STQIWCLTVFAFIVKRFRVFRAPLQQSDRDTQVNLATGSNNRLKHPVDTIAGPLGSFNLSNYCIRPKGRDADRPY